MVINLKVELIISEDIKDPSALIKSNSLTNNIKKAIDILEEKELKSFIHVKRNNNISFLKFEEIYLIKVENRKVNVFTEKQKYTTNKRLYELEEILDDSFIRISKSSIVNIKKIDYIAPSFKGIMFMTLENGLKDNISRKYLHDFKRKLGV